MNELFPGFKEEMGVGGKKTWLQKGDMGILVVQMFSVSTISVSVSWS